MNIYFDNAATTALTNEVIDVMHKTSIELFGNPSSIHSFGRKSRAAIEKARKSIAKQLNASPSEIVFTSCGTESNNMVLKMAIEKYNIEHLYISEAEHKAILSTAKEIANTNTTLSLHILKVNQYGQIFTEELAQLLASHQGSKLVSIMHANNEIGSLIDIESIANVCKQNQALFHSDTVQTIAHLPIDVKRLGVDFLSGSAHKFHGPKGIGFLYMKQKTKLKPLIIGGGQERNMRSGTENLIGIVALEKALHMSIKNMSIWQNQILELRSYFKQKLQENFDDILFNGDPENNLYTILSVSFPPKFSQDMFLFNLDIKGIAVSGGSACASGAHSASHVLQAIQHPENRQAIRFSFSHQNTKEEVDYVLSVLKSF